MTLEQLTLTLTVGTDTYQYQIYQIQSVDISSQKEAFSIAPPGLGAADNLLLGISGMQADINVTWMIHDDGNDKANGSYSEIVETVDEQLEYLENVMHSPDFSASWTLNHDTGTAFNDDEVFVENIDMNVLQLESPKWKEATLRLRRGKSIG